MPFVTKRMDKKYTTGDLSPSATFVSTPDCPFLKVSLLPKEKVFDEELKKYVQKPNSGVRIQFRDNQYSCNNRAIFRLIMNSKSFGKSHRGINIDRSDPTGFWRAAEVITVKEVQAVNKIADQVDMKKINFKGIEKKHAEMLKEVQPEEGDLPGQIEPLMLEQV